MAETTNRPIGRPTLMDELTVKKLEDAFSVGASDREACFIANISHQTLYNFQEKYPDFVDRKAALKEMTKYKARKVVAEAIEKNDIQQANWYLERKAKDEFSLRQELTGAEGGELGIILYPQKNEKPENPLETTTETGISIDSGS